MSSLQDVASLAGVSKSLVSRFINGQPGVSPASREKIRAAMEQLHYRPNALARSLVLRSTKTIGVVMDSLCEKYFFRLIDGLEAGADKTGYDVIYSHGRSQAAHKEKAVRYFMQGRTDGIVLYGSRLEDEAIIRLLADSGFPFVVIENTVPALGINNITVDNAQGSAMAVDFLVERGCRRIFHVSGGTEHRASLDRREGYIAAMKQHGLQADESTIIPASFDVQESCQAMRTFLLDCPRAGLPDACYCASDNTAYGVMAALEEAGYRVPEDVKVIGFDDDEPPAGHIFRPLTTLAQPLHQMGERAMEILCRSIESPEEGPQQAAFVPLFVERETT